MNNKRKMKKKKRGQSVALQLLDQNTEGGCHLCFTSGKTLGTVISTNSKGG
jgi:hypothetical protein